MSVPLSPKSPTKKTNYRVRFRHGVFPDVEGQATRADIKKYDYFFAAGQKWVNTEGKLDFIDESRLVAEEFESPANASEKKTSKQSAHSRTTRRISERGAKNPNKQEKRLRPRSEGWVDQAAVSTDNPTSVDIPWQLRQRMSPGPGSLSNYSSLDEPSPIDSPSDGPSPRPYPIASVNPHASRPLSDPIEAHLFRFWIEQASTSLDITNSAAVFKEVVPRLAFENPMLMNAIFMTSAQNILRHDPHFPAGPYLYHDRILQELIPYLAERGRIEDEATLITAMLLRTFEEFHAGTRGQMHLSTYELFHGPEGWLLDVSRPVVQACLMIHVHAELCQVLLDRPSLQINYRNYIPPALVVPEDDASWGNQILWITARIMQWTTSPIRTSHERQYLSDLVDEWESKRPATFEAILYNQASHDTGYFPELWFSDPRHADASQHLRISRIALAVSCLDTATAGTHRDTVIASVQDEVLRGLKEIVAIARCNPHCILASWKAAHAVHKFGVLLIDETARFKMIEFLEEVNAMGMPTAASIEYLAEQWNWRKSAGEWQ